MAGPNPQPTALDPQSLDGVLVIDKPERWTSHDVVARVRKILKTRRIGHTGTLDPFATGALVICVNRATRLAQFLVGDDKEYIATMRLGFSTDTGDLTGAPNTPVTDARDVTSNKIQEAFGHFRGRVKQIPPMYSAKKIGGVRLYEMARRGEEIERAPVEVEIKELELCDSPGNLAQDRAQMASQEFSFRVVCSSGAYVRTLAEDVGKVLGVGAHLTQLRRTRAGCCSLDRAVTLERLDEIAQSGQVDQAMISMADALAIPAMQVGEEERKYVSHGRSIKHPGDWRFDDWANGALAKICDKKNQLIAIAEYDSSKILWHPRVVLIG
ncbi:MAG: tRNA pseudouridine(55) synthase TruB [Blastocatellales bacterium]